MSIQSKSLQIVKALEPHSYQYLTVLVKNLGITSDRDELRRISHTLSRNGLVEVIKEEEDFKIILTEEGEQVLPFL